MSRRMWILQEQLAPDRPKWLHMAICPFCRGYLLGRRAIRAEWERYRRER